MTMSVDLEDPCESANISQEVIESQEHEDGGIRIGDIYIPPPPPLACTFDFTGPRLIITHIENYNFKSYAGKQVLGPLHKSFTAIVGPNGSGKSNVIDSMLFVFGYRAQKIRSKKISVLIHKSEKFPNLDSCCVRVHFRKIIDITDEEFEYVPHSEIVVSRTVNKDNTSWYTLNERKVPFKEVAVLLRTHGIDLDHNRFLILQGEVEQIAMMKPKALTEHETGMLEYLEDIIGSSRFKEPIELLNKRIEELNEQRTEKMNRVKVVEKEKDELEGSRNEAVEYLKLENEITLKKNTLFQKYKFDAKLKEAVTQEKRDVVKQSMKELTQEMESIKSGRCEKEKEHKMQTLEHEQFCKEFDHLKEEYSKLEREDVQQRENLKHLKDKGKKIKKALEAEQQKICELRNQPEKFNKEIEELKVRLQKLEAQQKVEETNLAEVLASLNEETQGIQEEKEKHVKDLTVLQNAVDETKSALNLAQSELDILLSSEENEKKKLENMTVNYSNVSTNHQKAKNSLKDVERRILETELLCRNVQTELPQLIEDEKAVNSQLFSSRLKVEEARSSRQAVRSRNQVLDALMTQKKEGKLPGVLGRLGDLGAIAEKYDVAISTACPRLDNIVTDTMSTAQKCVEFLKHNNVGVATFIALDKMEKWIPYTKQKIKTPEDVPRLFDLVQVKDESVLPAFYFSLQNCLVADNLEQATRIGLQGQVRYKVVTLRGELVELSGLMSGGGGKPLRGRMGQSVIAVDISESEIEFMVTKMNELITKSDEVKGRRQDLEKQAEDGLKELSILKQTHQRLKLEIPMLQEQEIQLAKQLEEQRKKTKSCITDQTQADKLKELVDNAKKDYEDASKAAAKVQDKVNKLHDKIMQITKQKMGAAQKKVDTVSNQIDIVTSTITKDSVAIKTANRNMKKSEEKILSLEKDIQENVDNIQKLKDNFLIVDEKAKNIMEQLEKTEKNKETVEEVMQSIACEVKKIKEHESAIQSNHLEVKNQLDKHNSELQEAQRCVKHWQNQISKLNLQEIDGEEMPILSELANEELERFDIKATQYNITLQEEKLKDMKPNMAAIAEYKKKESLYLQRVGELEEVTAQRDTQRKYYDDLKKTRLTDFMKGFMIISNKLKEMYQMITLGGDAELELVDSLDPFSEGIVFSVRPPKKSWKNISNLSGGEKTLSSLALVFALHYYRPSPLYVMDEIDAALDFRNVSIVGNYIKERTKNAQFIIISLRNNMFELADRLVGIYKTFNCTKSVTINPEKIASMEVPV